MVHSIFDSFTISVLFPIIITRRYIWTGIPSDNSESIPGNDTDATNAKQKKNQPRLKDYEGTYTYPSGMESVGATAVVTKTSAAMRDTFIV